MITTSAISQIWGEKKTLAANKQSNATNKVMNQPTDQPNKGIWKNNF
jgi:hypothetical protein